LAKNISVGVDIGNSQIKVVLLKKVSGNIKIERFFIENFNLSPNELAEPEIRQNKIFEILSKIFMEIKPVNVVAAVAKGEDNTRAFLMPYMAEKSLREAIKWGGQPDYVPFDLKEMVWDVVISQMYRRKEEIKTDGKEKMDVVLCLAKKEVVNRYLDIFEGLKSSIEILDSNVLAGLNFSIYNLPIMKDKVWAQLDFGGEITAVNILEGTNLKFSLNIPWGVNDIIETIQAVTGSSWTEAMQFAQKIDFAQDVIFQEPDVQKIIQALEPRSKDFYRQLNGAFNFYESKNPGRPISEIILYGGASKLNNLDKQIKGKLNRETKIGSALNKNLLIFDKKIEAELLPNIPVLNVALGCALRNLTEIKQNVNLLPIEVMLRRNLKSRRFVTVSIAVVLILLLSGLTGYKINQLTGINAKIASANKEIKEIKKESEELYNKKIAAAALSEMQEQAKNQRELFNVWSKIIRELTVITPRNVTLDNFSWAKGGINILAKCPIKNDEVLLFINNAAESKYFNGLTQGSYNVTDVINFSLIKRRFQSSTEKKASKSTPAQTSSGNAANTKGDKRNEQK
jgi:type IV pilus assembly protein PilM